MRRIYESRAVDRDDDRPFQPNEHTSKPRAARTLPARALSDLLVPDRVRYRVISVSVSTPRRIYERGEPVPITVTMQNAAPVPITIEARSPLLWGWYVDDHRNASRVPEEPSGEGALRFDRGERKQFRRRWNQLFRVTDSEWEEADTGEHTISAAINVDRPADRGVYDETTVCLR